MLKFKLKSLFIEIFEYLKLNNEIIILQTYYYYIKC